MIEMDIWYTKNLSLSVDFGIIFRTFPAILSEVRKQKGISPLASPPNLESAPPAQEDPEVVRL
jgi:hypothetical protein